MFIRVFRPDQRATFNGIIAIEYIAVGSHFLIIVCVIYMKVFSLEENHDPSANANNLSVGSNKLQSFLRQLRALKLAMLSTLANAFILAVGIVYCRIGSSPYQFVLWGLFWSLIWPVMPLVLRFLRSRNIERSNTAHSMPAPAEGTLGPAALQPMT